MLALDAYRVAALFGKGGIINHEGPRGIGQDFGHGGPVLAGHGRLIESCSGP